MGNRSKTLPDLMSLIPERQPKAVLRCCFDTLNLSIQDTERTVNAASKLISSIDRLLRGGDPWRMHGAMIGGHQEEKRGRLIDSMMTVVQLGPEIGRADIKAL